MPLRLVFAVLILLALSVPFAFALERVLIGATTIYKQISWFVLFFAVTFLILYLSHPAFAIANTPIIIFLGFAIVVMSVMVIFLIMRKFEVELKAIQGMTATVHVTDVSSVSTFMAAMQMGISTMRRRPMKPRHAITIHPATSTTLFRLIGNAKRHRHPLRRTKPQLHWCFLTTSTESTFRRPSRYHQVLLDRHLKEKDQQPPEICRRLWISPKTQDNPGILITKTDGTKPLTIKGVLGIEPSEIQRRPEFKEYFGSIDDDTILITKAVADSLGVNTGDQIIFKGRTFKSDNFIDAVKVSAAKGRETSSILPAGLYRNSANQQPTLKTKMK